MNRLNIITLFVALFCATGLNAQIDKSDWESGYPDGCTSITVGKTATVDGSVITSHTDDSHRTRSWVDIIPAKEHKKNAFAPMYKRVACDTFAMPIYTHNKIGEIPQVKHTHQFINTAYPCMNEHQLAIGESTFGGRDELQSDNGLIDCQRLVQLMLERTTTAREAILMADELTKKYGWNDAGECLTIADKNEVWHFEIVGPGKGKKGSVWVAQRVPNDHVSCNANASRIRKIDLNNSDFFMASENIFDVAIDNGWASSKENFEFCYAYAPHSRQSVASRRREWRIFDLLAPSQHFNSDDENFPFSIKPDKEVTLTMLVDIFKDYYEGTPYDMTRNITAVNADGNSIVSPLANPFLPYDQLEIDNVSGGWYSVDHKTNKIRFLGERTIARWYTMYGTITQSRNWLPDEVGGVVWLAQDNAATSVYIPVYCSVTDLPDSYKTPGRKNGYTMNSAWWAFNRLGTLTAQRWGEMRNDVDRVWVPLQKEMFDNQMKIEKETVKLLEAGKRNTAIKTLTKYTNEKGETAVKKAISLGDFLWTKYDEKF
ncbi:MAG: C69 family dipeptidase [Bacteroidota bacterium]|nr:C69 family dipeptidase [Bacteroidota bacterium]